LTILSLTHFLPYRLSLLANHVSEDLAGLYAARFSLSIPEWRVVAILGREAPLSAAEIARATAMDKVQISRAVSRLVKAGRLRRKIDHSDRRRSVLALSKKGQTVYRKIVPLALAFEADLTSALSVGERKTLWRLIDRLEARYAASEPRE